MATSDLPIKTPIKVPVQNADGSTSYRDDFNYSFSDPSDPTGKTPHPDFLGHIVHTGPIAGTVSLRSGNVYDVTEKYVHTLPEEGAELACVLHRMHNANNSPGYATHFHVEKCGREAGLPIFTPTSDNLGETRADAISESPLPFDTTHPAPEEPDNPAS